MTPEQVEFAILLALAPSAPPKELNPYERITDAALQAWFGNYYSSIQRQPSTWFIEGRREDAVIAGKRLRHHYLRVAVVHDVNQIRFVIEESRNLDESDTRIHSTAVLWIEALEDRIRRALGLLSVPPELLPANP